MAKFFILSCLLVNLFQLITTKSLSFVIDTSNSMEFEMNFIKNFTPNLDVDNYIDNYLLVPVSDLEIGPVTLTDSIDNFKQQISSLASSGRRECAGIVLEGIHKALEKSSVESHIYVFTDAEIENQSGHIDDIKELCQKSRSHVSIIFTKTCIPRASYRDVNTTIYQEITDSCGGQLITFQPDYLRYMYKFIQEVIQWDTIDFTTDHSVKCDGLEHVVHVDNRVAEVLILFSGDVYGPEIKNQEYEVLINSSPFKVLHVIEPKQSFTVTCKSYGHAVVKIGECTQFDFKIGFSPFKPVTMKETTDRPIADLNWYMLIESLLEELEPKEVEISVVGSKQNTYTLTQTHLGSRLYVSESFRVPDKVFRIIIITIDENGAKTRHISPSIPVQTKVTKATPSAPVGEILERDESNIVEYGSDREFICKVTAVPSPSVWWNDCKHNSYASETTILEYPDVYLSYVYIKNITTNLTINCNSRNQQGEDVQSTDVYVYLKSKFVVLEKPKDAVIDVYSEGTLNCKVDAVPEASIKWYLNDTLLSSFSDNVEMDEYSLTIKKMEFDKVGTYTCEIDNAIENRRFNAYVSISGLEHPSVSLDREDIIEAKVGTSLEMECMAQGKPEPEIRWSYRSKKTQELRDLPKDVTINGGKLNIEKVKSHHKGFYRCEAFNALGSDCLEVVILIESMPIIEQGISSIRVNEYRNVELPCKVEPSEGTKVHWEFYQNGNKVALGKSHSMDKDNTLRFTALWKDAGVYRCTAENENGRAVRDITVDVQVAPYIKPVIPNFITAKLGQEVSLPCIILYGHPKPTLSWMFHPLHTANTKNATIDIRSSSENFVIKKFSQANEGEYICAAENEVSYDRIIIHLQMKKH